MNKHLLVLLVLLVAATSVWAATLTVGPGGPPNYQHETIQAAINAANPAGGDIIQVAAGTYTGNILINKDITLISVSGTAATILDGNTAGPELGTIQLSPGRNGVRIGSMGQGFTVKGINGNPGLEKAAIYLQGAQANITIEDNILEARGDAALLGEYNAANTNIVINDNEFIGQTFVGANPAGVGFAKQFTLANVPRQVIVFGGGSGTTNTQNFTFTNNTISATAGGFSITADNGSAIAPTPQGNTLVTLDLAGTNLIAGNTFSGTTTRFAEALRVRGSGSYTITGNIFNGSYPVNISAATSIANVGIARIASAATSNTFSKSVFVKDGGNAVKVNFILTSIQNGIDAALAGDIVQVGEGIYNENVNVNKGLTLTGAGIGLTILRGLYGTGGGATLNMSASGSLGTDMTVSYDYGTTLAQWQASNKSGVIMGTGSSISNMRVTDHRNGVYANNRQNWTVHNCIIDNNRTGFQLVNNVSGSKIDNNFIENNFSHGILFNIFSNTTFIGTNLRVNSNSISSNWFAQVSMQKDGTGILGDLAGFDVNCNWFGTKTPVSINAPAGEPGYASQVPAQFGGVDPSVDQDIMGNLASSITYIPFLISGVDNSPDPGFQPEPGGCIGGLPVPISASVGPNGSIAPAGLVLVGYDGDQSFMITPNSGYTVADVLVDGSSVGALLTYTFSNVITSHTISATFAVSANGMKVAARNLLASYLTPTTDKKIRDAFEKAIKRIDESLEAELWKGINELTSKGNKVFDKEKEAANELTEKILKKYSGTEYSTALAAIGNLLLADRTLTQTAIDKVVCNDDSQCEKELAQANEEVAKAIALLEIPVDPKNYDNAIDRYKKAWEHAMKAAKKVPELGKSRAEFDAVPTQFELSPNYPNPFNPSTTITYALPADALVSIAVYDVLGRQVAQLVDSRESQGFHHVVFDAKDLASGVYYSRMTAQPDNGEAFVSVKKMMLTK